jgi:small subunit ribosomal protein S2
VSIRRLKALDEQLTKEQDLGITKKERLKLERERFKLERSLGGIKEMGGLPSLLFVVDTNKEEIAIQEARRLKIPVVAILDTNSDPTGINYPIPGNDDASRAINLYCELIAGAVVAGLREEKASESDIGDSAEMPGEAPAPSPDPAPTPTPDSQPAPEAAAEPAAASDPAPAAEASKSE